MRLIDADKFIEFIDNKYKWHEETDDISDQMLFDLGCQPTAFDVEMCIEALEGCEHVMVDGDIMISMNDAINVVKDGGIYETD